MFALKRNNNKIKERTASDILVTIVTYTFCIVFAIMCVYPFYYVIIYSISDPKLTAAGIYLWPKGFNVTVYRQLFTQYDIGNSFIVSVARTAAGTALSVLCTAFLAFLMTRREMLYRKFIYRLIIVTMYVSGGLIPGYLTIKAYNLLDTFWVYIIPGAISAYNMILIKTFIEQLPESLEESAMLEGAGIKDLFFQIVMPLSKPIIATVAVYDAVGHWNSWTDNFFYVGKTSLQTLQLVLYNYLNNASHVAKMLQRYGDISGLRESMGETVVTADSIKMAAIVVTVFPILFVYPFAQKYFTKGIMMGAVKG